MMVTYMDGCLMFAKNVPTIDTLIQNLSNISLLEDQRAVQGYLGIWIHKDNQTKTIIWHKQTL